NLKKYVDRHPLRVEEKEVKDDRNGSKLNWRNRDKLLFDNGGSGYRRTKCIYCDSREHSAVKCTKDILHQHAVREGGTSVGEAPYLNMPTTGKIVTGCLDGMNNSLMEKSMSSTLQNTSAIHPTLLANVEGKQVRLMIDTGESSSYICTDVIT
ncbi:Hypothetical predicted protein, partial [Paramuricea clavata]